jgi:hypothetical protein
MESEGPKGGLQELTPWNGFFEGYGLYRLRKKVE